MSDEYKLQKQYEIMEKNTQCSICVHGIKHVFEDRTLVDKPTFRTRGAKTGYNIQPGPIDQEQMALAVWVLGGYPFHTSSYFIRKSTLNDWINEKTDFMKYMNGDLSLLRFCLLHGSFYYMDEVMSCRRRGVSGSWSARWVQGDKQVRLKHYQNLIIGERKFDEYSAYRFHEYIQQHLFNLIAECCVYDTANIRNLLKENPLSIKIVKDKSSFWMYMRYLIIKMSPQLYKGLFDIQTKMMKNKQ